MVAPKPFPFMETPGIGAVLAGIAGLLNAWSFSTTGTFATVQSGNLVAAGYAIAEQDWDKVATVTMSVAAFGLGALVGAVAIGLRLRTHRAYSATILVMQAVILVTLTVTVATTLPVTVAVLAVSFVAGMQGNAFHRDHGMLYGNIAVTFVIQSVFGLIGQILIAQQPAARATAARTAGIYTLVLVAFAFGGAVGYLAQSISAIGAIVLAALTTAGLAASAAVESRRRVTDPSGAPTP